MATKQKSRAPQIVNAQSPVSADMEPEGDDANGEIVSANLRALEPVYYTAMLEEAHLFYVIDHLAAMFSRGMLPLGPGRAGAMLYEHWKGDHSRLTTKQRRDVYVRAFGLSGGDAEAMPNREFNGLWVRFVSIVGMYSAELQTLPPDERSVSAEDVLLSGRALALNLSNHGHGLAWFAAQDFKSEIKRVIELLSDAEILVAFGAKDPGEVIHNVAVSELEAEPNVQRAHTRAESGVIIIRWLANRRARLLRPRSANILRHEDIVEGRTAASQNKKASVYPTDSDLVTACERWLGVTGTQEAELKETEALVPPVEAQLPVLQEEPADTLAEA
jgi:hypothetical protein